MRSSLAAASSSADNRAMWVDPDDNIFAVGRFVGTVDFLGTSLTATSTSVPSGFIAKFDAEGSLQWVRKIGTDNFTELYAVAGFPNGDILVAGTASGNFSDNGVSFSIPSGNGQNGLLMKLNGSGQPVWAQNYGTSGTDVIASLNPTRDGEIAFGGYCLGSVAIGGVTLSCISRDGFVATVKNNGLVEWGIQVTGSLTDSVEFVDVDSENNIILGTNSNSTSLHLKRFGEASGYSVSITGNSILFAKYAKGASLPTWVRPYSGPSVLKLNKAPVVSARDEVILGGSYAGTVNFGGPTAMPVPVGASGFIVKLDKDGNFQWQKQVGDGPYSIGDQVMNLAVTPSGVIGVAGFMRSASTQLEGLPPFETSTTIYTGLFAMMDPEGNFLWADKIIGTGNVYSFHVESFSNSDFVFGGYTSSADFGDGGNDVIVAGPSNREAYLARYQGFPYPEIGVEQAANNLTHKGPAQEMGFSIPGSNESPLIFTIRNDGTAELTGIAPTLGGTHPGDFILDASATAPTLAPGATTTFSVQFSPTAIGARNASVSIASNDYDEYPFVLALSGTGILPAVSVAVAPESVAEDGTANLAYTFTRTGPTTAPLTVDFAVNGSAAFGTDYTQSGAAAFSASAGTVTIPAGSATAVVTIDPTPDPVLEADESVVLTVTSGSSYEAGTPDAATGTILNDDTEVTLAVDPTSLGENILGSLDFTFTRNGPLSAPLTVAYTVGGTAGFGSDYAASGADSFTASTGTVTFAAGNATAVVVIGPQNDSAVESDESITLTLAPGGGYLAVSPNSATATLVNDDTDVSVAVSPSSVVEDGATNLVFTFTRTGVTSGSLTTNFNVGGTAKFGSDYTQTGAASFSSSSGTVNFAAGVTTATVTVDPTADQTDTSDETVIVTVVSGSGYNPAAPLAATGTITNDDFPPEIAVEQPVGTGLTSGSSSVSFGTLLINTPSTAKTFTIRNLGTVQLTGVGVSVIGTNPGDFAITQPASTVNGGSSSTFTVIFTPSASGARAATLRIASNDANENPFEIALGGTGATARQLYDTWANAAGLSGPNAEPAATPFKDGVPNLLKYAFNMNAAGSDVRTLVPTTGTVGLPVLRFVSGASPVIRYEFIRRKNSGLTYAPQQSSVLTTGSWQAATGTTTVTNIDTAWERVVIEQPYQPGTTPRRFHQVRVAME